MGFDKHTYAFCLRTSPLVQDTREKPVAVEKAAAVEKSVTMEKSVAMEKAITVSVAEKRDADEEPDEMAEILFNILADAEDDEFVSQ